MPPAHPPTRRKHVAPLRQTMLGRTARCLSVMAVLTACAVPRTAADSLILRTGQTLPIDSARFEAGRFHFGDDREIPRDLVVDWWLSDDEDHGDGAPSAGLLTATGDLAAVQRMRSFRQEGARLGEQFPGVPAVLVVDDGEYTLTHDRRHVYHYHMVVLILDESRLDMGRISLGFTEGRSRCRIISGRCLTPDDRLLSLPPESAKVSTPSRESVHFDPNSRILSASVPGVEVGALVELVYEFEKYAPEDWRLFFPGYYFQGELPVWRSNYIARVPVDVDLYAWVDNWNGYDGKSVKENWKPSVFGRLFHKTAGTMRQSTWQDGKLYREYRWSRTNMAPVIPEPQMPPRWRVVPAVHGSIFRNWDYLNELTGSMQRERIEVTADIEKLANTLVADADTVEQRVAAVYHWVQKNIRYISIKASLSSGWAGHRASQTLQQGYGDCTDKSVLLCSLLKAINIEAQPLVLLTNDEGTFAPPYPVLMANHCITEVHAPELGTVILDSTSQDYRYPHFRGDNHGVFAINFITGRAEMTRVPPGMVAQGKTTRERMVISPDGNVDVVSSNHYSGDYEAGLRAGWKRVPTDIRGQVMQQYLNGISPGAKLTAFNLGEAENLSQPFFLDYSYRLPNYVKSAGNYRLLQLPDRELSFEELSSAARRYPLVYRTSEARERLAEIILPQGWEAIELPRPGNVKTPFLVYREEFRREDDRIVVETYFERPVRDIAPDDYAAFRRAARKAEELSRRLLYLKH